MATERKREIGPEAKAELEEYKRLATPGEEHRLLAGLAGSWTVKSRWWSDPGKPPEESAGSCERKTILGGRYLQEEYSGDMMGSPFSGIGITGFDNHTKKFVSTWIDTMSTGIMYFEGRATTDKKTINFEGSGNDPVKGPIKLRSVTRLLDNNTNVMEMYVTGKSGSEEKMAEMTYTRKKK